MSRQLPHVQSSSVIWGTSLFTVLFLFVPTAVSQTSTALQLDDPAGDVFVAGPAPHPFDFIDLTRATLTPEETGLAVELQVAGTQTLVAYSDQFFGSGMELTFSYREETFTTSFAIASLDSIEATLSRGTNRLFAETTAYSGSTIPIVLPWNAIQSSTGFTPVAGEKISLKSIASFTDLGKASSVDGGFSPAYGRDEIVIPEGTALESPGTQASFRISSPRPALSANGEEAVHSWTVELTDLAGSNRIVKIDLDSGDATSVDYPSSVQVPANGVSSFRVTALFPFAHQHGGSRTLTVHATEGSDSADYALQVNYIQPPQPAGHHDRVHIHVFGDDNPNNIDRVTMNTTADTTGELPAGPGGRSCQSDNRAAYTWIIPLAPGLEIGLDGRPGENIQFTGTIRQELPALPVDLRARLALGEDGLAPRLDLTDEFTLVTPWTDSPGQDVPISLEIPLPPEFDYVEPQPGVNLYFILSLCSTTPEAAAGLGQLAALPAGQVFKLQPGAYLQMPLNDFRPLAEPVTNGLNMVVDERFKPYPPGSDAIWNVSLNNAGSIQLDFLAPTEYNARIHARTADGFTVAMTVPQDSQTGGLLDFVVIANQGESRGELRLGVYVDDQAESLRLTNQVESNGAPGPNLLHSLVLLALGCMLLRR